MSFSGMDARLFEQLQTADMALTLELLVGLVAAMPEDYQPVLQSRLDIYRGFVTSKRFQAMTPEDPQALTFKGWMLRDWAEQAKSIKEQIETALTGD